MRLKEAPVEPKEKLERYYSFSDIENLQELIEEAKREKIEDLSKVIFDYDPIDAYGSTLDIYTYIKETDKEFEKRVRKYKYEVLEYNKWFLENQEEIKKGTEKQEKIKRLYGEILKLQTSLNQ